MEQPYYANGVELECLIPSENLSIINSNASDLDFTPGGTSFLDVTLAGNKVVVSRWFFLLSFYTLALRSSLHIVLWNLRACYASRIKKSTSTPTVPPISRINLSKFSAQLSVALKSFPLSLSPSKRDIDSLITDVSSLTSVSARNSKSDHSPLPHRRCMPWWNKKLCALRNNTRTSSSAAPFKNRWPIGFCTTNKKRSTNANCAGQRGDHGNRLWQLNRTVRKCFRLWELCPANLLLFHFHLNWPLMAPSRSTHQLCWKVVLITFFLLNHPLSLCILY